MKASFEEPFVYKGVDLNVALRGPLYGGATSNVIKSLLWSHALRPTNTSCDIAIVYSYLRTGRSDYRELVDNLVSYLGKLSAEILFVAPAQSIRDRARMLKHLLRTLPSFGSVCGKLGDRLALICMIARAKATVDLTFDFLDSSRFRVLVTFCDAHEIDNLMAQCARLRCITTVTLQHGQYHINARDLPENLALQNLVSDYLCAWGQATVDEAAKIENNRTLIWKTGSLKGYAEDRCFYELTDFEPAKDSQEICVMLNADNCYASNCALIELVNEYCSINGSFYRVRYHPRNKRHKYEKLYNDDCYREYKPEDSDKIGIYLVYTSGVFTEMLARRVMFFFYVDDETPDLFRIDQLSFRSLDTLANRIDWVRRDPENACAAYNAASAYFLEPGNARAHYESFFDDLLSETGTPMIAAGESG